MVRSLLGQLKPRQGQIKLASDIKIGYVPHVGSQFCGPKLTDQPDTVVEPNGAAKG